jgi:hypothetical protein
MNTWALRAIWISMPVTAGNALADAIRLWPDASRVTASALLWVGWTIVLLATLVPRPWSLTMTRFGLPIAFGAAVIATATGRPSTLAAVLAIGLTAVAVLLGTRGEFARVCAQGAAYGDEERFPLKVPPALLLGILPIAVAIVAGALVGGPLLLANREWVAAAVVLVVCVPLGVAIVRLVHQLSRRWVVLVPAGLVVADPLTLTDPVLFPRATIMGLGPADPARKPPEDACDLRLGASFGSCALLLAEDADIMRRVRNQGVAVHANLVLVTPTAAPRLLERARARRIHVRTD